jgi:hypothetical protein
MRCFALLGACQCLPRSRVQPGRVVRAAKQLKILVDYTGSVRGCVQCASCALRKHSPQRHDGLMEASRQRYPKASKILMSND